MAAGILAGRMKTFLSDFRGTCDYEDPRNLMQFQKNLNTITNTHLLLISGSKTTSPRPGVFPLSYPFYPGPSAPFSPNRNRVIGFDFFSDSCIWVNHKKII